jgi:hypothetical protein
MVIETSEVVDFIWACLSPRVEEAQQKESKKKTKKESASGERGAGGSVERSTRKAKDDGARRGDPGRQRKDCGTRGSPRKNMAYRAAR